MGFPWEVVPRQRLLAWVLWLCLIAGFLTACIVSLVAAIKLRQHPLVNTYFDTHVPVTYPDIQLCLAAGDGPDTTVKGPSGANLSIGCTLVNMLPHAACPVPSADIGASNVYLPPPNGKPPTVFIYREKGEAGPGVPFLPKEGSTVATTSFSWMEPLPFKKVDNIEDESKGSLCKDLHQNTAILTGVNPQFACITLYTSLCPPQPQAQIVSDTGIMARGTFKGVNPAFYLSLRGTGEDSFKFLSLAVGDEIKQSAEPQYGTLATGWDQANLYLNLNKNTTPTVIVTKHVRRSLRSLNLFQPNSGRKEAASYTVERDLRSTVTEAVYVAESASNASFWLDLTIYFSTAGVVYQEEQDPILSILATFGGYWPFVVLAFGLCFSVKEKPPPLEASAALECLGQLCTCRHCRDIYKRQSGYRKGHDILPAQEQRLKVDDLIEAGL